MLNICGGGRPHKHKQGQRTVEAEVGAPEIKKRKTGEPGLDHLNNVNLYKYKQQLHISAYCHLLLGTEGTKLPCGPPTTTIWRAF